MQIFRSSLRWALPVGAVSVAFALTVVAPGGAFGLLGHSLGPDQRDFRVFNNFADPTANDNTVADPNFPGASGAVLAIWKAGVEWGSRLHADGEGDPHQPGDLGSGGANMDFSYQGQAFSPGALGDNVHSAISGTGSGITLFAEFTPAGDWRMRYSDSFVWEDGPGLQIPATSIDLQGAATYAFGVALGLGSSSVASATMHPTFSMGAVDKRSIEADDIAGVQFIYGAASPLKPVIDGVVVQGSQVMVMGSGFDPSNNTLWFTRDSGPSGTGEILTVTGLPSVLGQQINATIPAEAQSGDLLVRTQIGGGAGISNAWPYEIADDPCPAPTVVCAGEPNSVSSTGASLEFAGSQDVASNDVGFVAGLLPPGVPFLPIFGMQSASVPLGMGTLCLGAPLYRLDPGFANGAGGAFIPIDLLNLPSGQVIQPGDTWLFQVWYRDQVASGSTSNLTSAIAVPFCD